MKKLLFLLLLFITVSILLIKRPFSHEQKETIKKNDEDKNAETENILLRISVTYSFNNQFIGQGSPQKGNTCVLKNENTAFLLQRANFSP